MKPKMQCEIKIIIIAGSASLPSTFYALQADLSRGLERLSAPSPAGL
jgi:hypothetical protein